ncbi:MAG: TonB-dependent receptor [bacterium]|nr:TonB-dependent receptor [bacterium]
MNVTSTVTYLLVSTCIVLGSCHNLFAQNVSGKIRDTKTKEPVIGAVVLIKGTTQGTSTDADGNFSIPSPALPFTLSISNIGYIPFELAVASLAKPFNLKMKSEEIDLSEVEIVARGLTEKQKESPLTVEALDATAIKATSAANFYEGLGQLKGVDLTSASIGFRIINTRGFNSTSPVRSLQLIDGVDNQSPGLNFSLGNFLGASELDVQKAEIIVGASSAYYGPNAFNGVISMTTKNPYIKPGLNILIKVGERDLLETAGRYAEVFKNKKGEEKFAFKFNFSYMRANDWQATNMDPVYGSADAKNNWGGYNAVNRYGDEIVYHANSNGEKVQFPGLGNFYRTGYEEKDIVNYDSRNLKLATALHYKIRPTTELIYSGNYGSGTTVYQGDNRYSLKDIRFFQNRLELKNHDKYFIRAYATNEDAGNSYDAVTTAYLLQNISNSNAAWGNKAYRNYYATNVVPLVKQLPGFPTVGPYIGPGNPNNYYYDYTAADAVMNANANQMQTWHNQARNAADNGSGVPFLIPGSQAYTDAFNEITSKPLGKGGSKFIDRSALYHIHGEYKFNLRPFELKTGANYRLYKPKSEGTIFSDTGNVVITNHEYGFYAGLEKKILMEKMKLNLTGRIDKNKNFDFIFSPAASAVYNLSKDNIIRLSFSAGIRNPTLQDQYLYYNVGNAILLGNLNGFDSLVTIESIQNYYNEKYVDRNKLSYFNVAKIVPEKVKSIELGYRTTLFHALFIDGSCYYSLYKDFLGYQQGGAVNFNPGNPNEISNITFYRVAANAKSSVTTQGLSIGATYYLLRYFSVMGNYSYNELNKKGTDDPIIPAFNTPKNKFNIGFSGRDVRLRVRVSSKSKEVPRYIALNDFGFSVNFKWVEGYNFTGSPQFTGMVPSYNMVDAQVSKYVPKIKTTFKFGGSNLLNNQRFQVYGGPKIGRLIYFSALLELDRT